METCAVAATLAENALKEADKSPGTRAKMVSMLRAELIKALATDSPQQFFTVLRGCNALAVLFPEIDRDHPELERLWSTLAHHIDELA